MEKKVQCPLCGFQTVDQDLKICPDCGANILNYKGFWIRLCAFIFDYCIIIIPCYLFYIFFQLLFHQPFDNFGFWEMLAYYGIITLIGWLYDSIFWSSKYEATPGKLLLGMKVTDLSGQRISFKRASIRWLGKIIAYLTFGIGFMIIGFTSKKQGLHDYIAKTVVIQR